MKTIKCSEVGGGECAFEVQAETMEEAKEKLTAHAKEAHADMMASSTEEDMKKWNENFEENVWPNAPETEKES